MTLLFNLDLGLFYVGEEGLEKSDLAFTSKKSVEQRTKVKLFLGTDGYFDVVCEKAEIKAAGICQSLVLDVSYHIACRFWMAY